jgi:hypothetical protein
MFITFEFVPYEQSKTMMRRHTIIPLPEHSLIETPIVASLERTRGRLVSMLTVVVSAGLFTACVKPSLMISLYSIMTRLAYFRFTIKVGKCSALYYSGRAISLEDINFFSSLTPTEYSRLDGLPWFTCYIYYMITCSREWGVTENTLELNHDGLSSPIYS